MMYVDMLIICSTQYIDGRTPLFKAASKGHAVIVAQLMAAHSNNDLAKTTDGSTPLFIAAKKRHAAVVEQLITARCKIDLALKNELKAISIAARNGHTRVMARTQNLLTFPNTDYLHAAGGVGASVHNALYSMNLSMECGSGIYLLQSTSQDHTLCVLTRDGYKCETGRSHGYWLPATSKPRPDSDVGGD
jgi:hypothetical protein